MQGTSRVRLPSGLGTSTARPRPTWSWADDGGPVVGVGVGGLHGRDGVEGPDDGVADEVGEADLGRPDAPEVAVDDLAVDLEQAGRHHPGAGGGGDAPGWPPCWPRCGPPPPAGAGRRASPSPGRRPGRRPAGRAGAGAWPRRRGRGRRRRPRAPAPAAPARRRRRPPAWPLGRQRDALGPVVLEEVAPAGAHRRRIGPVPLVHLVDQTGVGPEAPGGAGRTTNAALRSRRSGRAAHSPILPAGSVLPVAPETQSGGHQVGDVVDDRYELLVPTPLRRHGRGVAGPRPAGGRARSRSRRSASPRSSSEAARTALTEKLLAEARTLAELEHPGLVRVVDILDAHDPPLVVTELVEGPTLADIVAADGPMSPERVAVVGLAALEALAACAAAGLVAPVRAPVPDPAALRRPRPPGRLRGGRPRRRPRRHRHRRRGRLRRLPGARAPAGARRQRRGRPVGPGRHPLHRGRGRAPVRRRDHQGHARRHRRRAAPPRGAGRQPWRRCSRPSWPRRPTTAPTTPGLREMLGAVALVSVGAPPAPMEPAEALDRMFARDPDTPQLHLMPPEPTTTSRRRRSRSRSTPTASRRAGSPAPAAAAAGPSSDLRQPHLDGDLRPVDRRHPGQPAGRRRPQGRRPQEGRRAGRAVDRPTRTTPPATRSTTPAAGPSPTTATSPTSATPPPAPPSGSATSSRPRTPPIGPLADSWRSSSRPSTPPTSGSG